MDIGMNYRRINEGVNLDWSQKCAHICSKVKIKQSVSCFTKGKGISS